MGRARAIFVLIILFLGLARAAETTPAMVWTGTAPSGACAGNRVVTTAAGGALYCCVASTWTACGSSGGSPGGADTQVQFNDGGSAFGGDAGLTYDKTTDKLTVAGGVADSRTWNSSWPPNQYGLSLKNGVAIQFDAGGSSRYIVANPYDTNSLYFSAPVLSMAGIVASDHYQSFNNGMPFDAKGQVNTTGTAKAVKFGNTTALTTAGDKIASFFSDNMTTEKAYIDKDGTGRFLNGVEFDSYSWWRTTAGNRMQLSSYWATEIAAGRQNIGAPGYSAGGASDPSLIVTGPPVNANDVAWFNGRATITGKLSSWRVNGSEKAYIDKDGGYHMVGAGTLGLPDNAYVRWGTTDLLYGNSAGLNVRTKLTVNGGDEDVINTGTGDYFESPFTSWIGNNFDGGVDTTINFRVNTEVNPPALWFGKYVSPSNTTLMRLYPNGTVASWAASGQDAFKALTGARIHFGGGASDYASSNGTTVTFASPLAASSLSLTTPLAGASGGVGVALPTCTGTDKLTANGTQVSCAADQTGAGGSPGGSNQQIQFNDSSTFGGATNLLWNKATNTLTANDDTVIFGTNVTGSTAQSTPVQFKANYNDGVTDYPLTASIYLNPVDSGNATLYLGPGATVTTAGAVTASRYVGTTSFALSSSPALPTCGAAYHGAIYRQGGSAGTYTYDCQCQTDGTTYLWRNLSTNATGNTTTCPSGTTIPLAAGGTGLATAAIDTVLLANPANTWTAGAVPTCSGGSNALTYNVTSHAFGCNTFTIPTDISGAGYWTKTSEANLSNEFAMGSLGTGLIINTTTTGIPTIYGGTSCTNQFPRSLNASGAATCAGIGVADFTANQGTTTTVLHGNAAGQPSWGGVSLTADAAANQGTATQSLHGNAAGQPTWKSSPDIYFMTQDRSTTSTTGATTTDLTWSIAASTSQRVDCNFATINTATSLLRFAVAGPASMTTVACQFSYYSTATGTMLSQAIQGQWASTCTNCTPSVAVSVLTTILPQRLSCTLLNGANAGSITIYFAASTSGQTTTLKKGSSCTVWNP